MPKPINVPAGMRVVDDGEFMTKVEPPPKREEEEEEEEEEED